MPCYRCGARQTDPVRGPSPWKKAVRAGTMVLICPDCQREHAWTEDMDRCTSCGAANLVRALGETTCRTCGASFPDEVEADTGVTPSGAPGLSEDVSAALQRAFKRDRD